MFIFGASPFTEEYSPVHTYPLICFNWSTTFMFHGRHAACDLKHIY